MASGFVTLAPETLSQQVNRAVEPLVDALSSLVLECIGGSMKDVSQHAVKLADSTNVLITIAQKVALAESDEELTTEIINSINFIADQIELLVSAFSSLLSNRTDPTAIKNFATAAQNVGDAINTLVVASDETSQKRMTSLVRKAIQRSKVLETAAAGRNRGELINQISQMEEIHKKLVEVTGRAAVETAHPNKKDLLYKGSDGVRDALPKLVKAARELNDDPSDPSLHNDYNEKAVKLSSSYKHIVEAVKIEEASDFARLKATLARVAALIEATKRLQRDANDLLGKIMSDVPVDQRQHLIDEVEQEINEIAGIARGILQDIHDPIVKKVVEKALRDIEESGKMLLQAAKLTGPEAKRQAQIAMQQLLAAANRLVVASRPTALGQFPIHLGTDALGAAIYDLERAIELGDPAAILKAAGEIASFARGVADELMKKADATDDPVEKARYTKAADHLKNAALKLLAAAKKLAENPNDPAAKAALLEAQKELNQAISMARSLESTPDGFENVDLAYRIQQMEEEERRRKEEEERARLEGLKAQLVTRKPITALDFEITDEDDPLVRAAKEQALAALEVIREAEQYVRDNPDPDFARKVAELSEEIKQLCVKLVDAARVAAANPNDAEAQRNFAGIQAKLNGMIGQLAGMTKKGNKELEDALRSLADATSDNSEGDPSGLNPQDLDDFYKLMAQIIKLIEDNWVTKPSITVQVAVAVCKDVSGLVQKGGVMLNKMAKGVKAQDFADKLSSSSKIICDNALKMKILAAVKAAAGDDNTGQVKSAALGLKTQITEVVNNVKALTLRHRVKQTQKQMLAIKKIAAAVRKARFF